MKWIATNIRFPEDMYMDLKIEAAKKRVSLAKLVREKVTKKKKVKKKSTKKVETIMKELDRLATQVAKENHGVSLSEKLIEMRYEQ